MTGDYNARALSLAEIEHLRNAARLLKLRLLHMGPMLLTGNEKDWLSKCGEFYAP